MRLYEYRCKNCKHECEEFANSPESVVKCPKCGEDMTKLISGTKHRFEVGHFFEPYVDTDIHPEGEPIVINSREQFFAECRKHGKGWKAITDKMR